MSRRLKKSIMIVTMVFIILILLDYMNISTFYGMEMSNINWDFWVGIVNVIVVIVLYLVTYKTLDERAAQRENNKREISMLFINDCYRECEKYVQLLNQETVEKYIVPKIDFNSSDNILINNLQSAPFFNEDVILDLVKDGQITKQQINCYLKIKEKFKQYIRMRIAFYDAEQYYEPLKLELCDMIDKQKGNAY